MGVVYKAADMELGRFVALEFRPDGSLATRRHWNVLVVRPTLPLL